MSIGSHLASPENLELVGRSSWKFGRPVIMDAGRRYYDANPTEVQTIADNLDRMDMPNGGAALDAVLDGIIAHYYEKLFSLVKTYEAVWIVKNRVDMGDSLAPLEEAKETGKALFIGQSHFGATYLMAGVLFCRGYELHSVGNFPPPVDGMIKKNIDTMSERYGTAKAHLLNLATGDVDVPMEMLRLLMMKKTVSNVFDENNQFCRPVKLLGKELMGGTGMDLILRNFNDDKVVVVTPFLIRTSDESFRYEVDRHYLAKGDIIDSFYRSLEKRVRDHPEQWYFLHELHESFEDKR